MEEEVKSAKKIERFMVKKLLKKINDLTSGNFSENDILKDSNLYFNMLDRNDVEEATQSALFVHFGKDILKNDFFSFINLNLDAIALIFRFLNNSTIRNFFLVDKKLKEKEKKIVKKIAGLRGELLLFKEYKKRHPFHLEHIQALQTMELVNLFTKYKDVSFRLIYSPWIINNSLYNEIRFERYKNQIDIMLEFEKVISLEVLFQNQ
jgi:hypothetical protein